ncbi:MAG: hypothetical protein J6D30_05085 [Clostridia bacterium]|nr:hypothetical protein [Clostridia bacterium]
MYFWEWYFGFFIEDSYRGIALLSVCVCVTVFTILSACIKSQSTYFGLTFCLLSFYNLLMLAYERSLQAAIVCNLSLGIWIGACFLILQFSIWLHNRRKQKRRERAEILRKLEFTLPDRENNYVRARLNTTLQCTDRGEKKAGETTPVLRLEYVKKLLTSVRNAPLTMTERLEAEDMTKLFNVYLSKSKWTSEDVRAVNDLFSRLLKLSAKYAV